MVTLAGLACAETGAVTARLCVVHGFSSVVMHADQAITPVNSVKPEKATLYGKQYRPSLQVKPALSP